MQPRGPALFDVTPELAAAAALVAEADAIGFTGSTNLTLSNTTMTDSHVIRDTLAAAAIGTYWMETIDGKGAIPWGKDTNYKVCSVE